MLKNHQIQQVVCTAKQILIEPCARMETVTAFLTFKINNTTMTNTH